MLLPLQGALLELLELVNQNWHLRRKGFNRVEIGPALAHNCPLALILAHQSSVIGAFLHLKLKILQVSRNFVFILSWGLVGCQGAEVTISILDFTACFLTVRFTQGEAGV